MQQEEKQLCLQAEKIRRRVVEIIHSAKGGHIGGSLSSVEIETVLYFYVMHVDPKNPSWDGRDRFILSKGHSCETLYSTLEAKGFFTKEYLDTYGKYLSPFAGHPTKNIPGIEINSGALGHGLSVGVGMAIAKKMDNRKERVYVLMGDGEQGEGSIYEAAMAGPHYHLDNLVAIIDRNHLQISGDTEDVMTLEPMRKRWEAFGWDVVDVDGNNIAELIKTFDAIDYADSKPTLIIAHTVKGKGVSYMENLAKWHHGVPTEEQYEEAMKEIDARVASL
jgi:transketolase